MHGVDQNEIGCDEFQAMLADALDGTLPGAQRTAFEAHRRSCPDCAPLHEEAGAGRRWLRTLQAEEVIPPPRLLEDILRATSRAELAAPRRQRWWQQLQEFPELLAVWQTVSQPRFAMAFAMAFFSFAAILAVTGVRLGELRAADLQPSALMRDCYEAGGKAVSYYDNIRWVYEVESRVRELRGFAATEESTPREPDMPGEPKQEPRPREPQNPSHSEHQEIKPKWLFASAFPLPGAAQPVASSSPDENRRWL
jgi:hypothetical protein